MGPDFRVLVRKGRKSAQQYFRERHLPPPASPSPSLARRLFSPLTAVSPLVSLVPGVYRETIPVAMLVRELAAVMQEFTQRGGVRPFGISLLLAGYDHNGPQLYQIDPSGSYFAWKASAIGKHMVNAKTFLEKRYTNELELEDAVHTALLTLKEGFEGAMDHTNIEVGIVGADGAFKVLTPAEIKDYLGEVE